LEIEVAPDSVTAALHILQRSPGITDTSREDGTLRFVGAERETIPELIAALVTAGIRIYRVTPEEPSLTDVYFALHGEGGDAR
jgi:ABC-2 type transport system ATP-binding protein